VTTLDEHRQQHALPNRDADDQGTLDMHGVGGDQREWIHEYGHGFLERHVVLADVRLPPSADPA
jgi:hypothetical protein